MYHKTTIVGRLGRDPEMRYTKTGDVKAVASFSVAVNQGKDAQGNERDPVWYKVVVWQRLAEVCSEYLSKGDLVLVEGQIKIEKFTRQDGTEDAALRMDANLVKFLETKGKQAQGQAYADQGYPQPQDYYNQGNYYQDHNGHYPEQGDYGPGNYGDDHVPF